MNKGYGIREPQPLKHVLFLVVTFLFPALVSRFRFLCPSFSLFFGSSSIKEKLLKLMQAAADRESWHLLTPNGQLHPIHVV